MMKRPATLLDELGITQPSEIDIEAIAQYCGATIVYEPLRGCAARIIGMRDRAIITIDSEERRERQRFSAAHELGHWMHDRGQVAFACTTTQLVREWDAERDNPERRANRYAANLLMPSNMVKPLVRGLPGTFESVKRLACTFQTSLTAAAIKFVELGELPLLLVCNERSGRKWFTRSPLIPQVLWPVSQPGSGSAASKMLTGRLTESAPEDVDADDWIEHVDSARYMLVEHSMAMGDGVLSLLWWKDERQILDLDEDADDRGWKPRR